ncbi:MAG: hypothetical protein MZV70_12555 [Desulfobacterales bacterium]|nr:hypothetical protein [Desulfobacterales bacterium]
MKNAKVVKVTDIEGNPENSGERRHLAQADRFRGYGVRGAARLRGDQAR